MDFFKSCFFFQEWVFTFTASKTTLHFIFAHKWYFQDLIDDWSAKSPPDLLYFVPYTWKFQFICKKFELVTSGNEYNWIGKTTIFWCIYASVVFLFFSNPYILMTVLLQKVICIQLPTFAYNRLRNKPYENEVTLTG